MRRPTAAEAAASPQCATADRLDWPEPHAWCPGNTVLRLPGDTDANVPVQTYRCGCDCHADQQPHTVYVGSPAATPTTPGRPPREPRIKKPLPSGAGGAGPGVGVDGFEPPTSAL